MLLLHFFQHSDGSVELETASVKGSFRCLFFSCPCHVRKGPLCGRRKYKAILPPYMKSTLLPGCKALCPAKTLCRFGRTCKTASVGTLIRQVYAPPIKIPQSKGGLPPIQIPESKGGAGEEEGCGGSAKRMWRELGEGM